MPRVDFDQFGLIVVLFVLNELDSRLDVRMFEQHGQTAELVGGDEVQFDWPIVSCEIERIQKLTARIAVHLVGAQRVEAGAGLVGVRNVKQLLVVHRKRVEYRLNNRDLAFNLTDRFAKSKRQTFVCRLERLSPDLDGVLLVDHDVV